ncbi:hypothetical protein [Stappia sediminis]|nr:hypothetical protein [Stappia sediminis]
MHSLAPGGLKQRLCNAVCDVGEVRPSSIRMTGELVMSGFAR